MKYSFKKILFRTGVGIIVFYFLLVAGLFLFQDKIIFHPIKLSADYRFKFDIPFTEVNIATGSGTRLNGLIFKAGIPIPKGTILYFHGNADNIQRWGEYAIDFTALGYTVVMFDYSGFGKSTGKPSEKALYQNANDILDWSKKNIPDKNFIYYGRSLGTAVASYLASYEPPEQLILETPFYRLLQQRIKFFIPFGLKYRFPNYEYIQKVICPITIFQGTDDHIVPYDEAVRLKPLLKPGDRFIVIEKGGHKNLRDFPLYHVELAKTLEQ